MQVTSEGAHRLIIAYDSSGFARMLAGLTLIFFALAGWRYVDDGGTSEQFRGSLAAAATCLLMAAVVFERSRFVIDAAGRFVEWRRRTGYSHRRGLIAFSDIKAVVAERSLGEKQVPMRRVVIRTTTGDVPITRGYLPDSGDAALDLASKLRVKLGVNQIEAPVPHEVAALASAGRHIEAARLLRKRRGGTLRDAHATVQEIPCPPR